MISNKLSRLKIFVAIGQTDIHSGEIGVCPLILITCFQISYFYYVQFTFLCIMLNLL